MRALDDTDLLEAFLQEEGTRVDAALSAAVEGLGGSLSEDLFGPIRHGVLAEGKRLRPILCVAAYRASLGHARAEEVTPPALYDLAAALELVHAYSLMHDDLPCMDDAPLRRGQPTPHTVFGEAPTVLAAAFLIPAAARHALRAATALGLDTRTSRGIVSDLVRAAGAGGMVGGQGLDLLGEGRRLSREELDGLHRRKTGALLMASLVLGATAAGAGAAVQGALRLYGSEIGLAFQIADDILDATADAKALGKNPSDLALEKSTYVSLLGVAVARVEAAQRVESACRALASAGIPSPILHALAHYVVARDR
ncbi:MAG: polyprenyl synthetase family protein [Gemmatimonadota bacterium]